MAHADAFEKKSKEQKIIKGEPFFSLVSRYRNDKSGTNREKEALGRSWLLGRLLFSDIYTKAVKGSIQGV